MSQMYIDEQNSSNPWFGIGNVVTSKLPKKLGFSSQHVRQFSFEAKLANPLHLAFKQNISHLTSSQLYLGAIVLIMDVVTGISRRASEFLLRSLGAFLSLTETSPSILPKDPRTLRTAFGIVSQTAKYALCPACFAIYSSDSLQILLPPSDVVLSEPPLPIQPPAFTNTERPQASSLNLSDLSDTDTEYSYHEPNVPSNSPARPALLRCVYRDFPNTPPCNALLTRYDKHSAEYRYGHSFFECSPLFTHLPKNQVPIKHYFVQSFTQWLAGLVQRPNIEKLMDSTPFSQSNDGMMRDIWDGSWRESFRGNDGNLFFQKGHPECRMAFSLFIDWFNPYTNKLAGAKISSGGIYMVCLNLPSEIRYLKEYMYLVGVIPGPAEPSLEQINHLLRPLVEEMLRFWTHGFYIDSTHDHPGGRRFRGAIIPLIADLPGARKVAGRAGYRHSEHTCDTCDIPLEKLNDLDIAKYNRLSREAYLVVAKQWRDARSKAERDNVFSKHGIRWSELLRLPYWDATRFVVVEGVHALIIGLLQAHVRRKFKMHASPASKPSGPRPQPRQDHVSSGNRILSTSTLSANDIQRLSKLSAASLAALCEERNIPLNEMSTRGWFPQKNAMVSSLIAWVSRLSMLMNPSHLTLESARNCY